MKGKEREYNDFLKALGRVLSATPARRAPSDLADKVMLRLGGEVEPAPVHWGLKPALAFAGLAAIICLMVLPLTSRRDTHPKIISFTVDNKVVTTAQPVTLRWKVANAKKVIIKGVNGTAVEPPAGDNSLTLYITEPGQYSFVLVAMGEKGEGLQRALTAE